MPLFSVIIPAFNRAALIGATLDSVSVQEFKDYEVIVIDDGSKDGTADVVVGYENVRVIPQPNGGPGAARNRGIDAARGRYVAFLDSDDLWFPWTLVTYAAIIEEHDSPAFIAGRPWRFQRDEELSRASNDARVSERFPDYIASGDRWRWWGVSSFVVKLEEVRRVHGFVANNVNGEDADLALRLGEAPGFVQIRSPCTFAYREHDGNLTLNLTKTVAGAWHKVRSEKTGQYPGGENRARERWRILARHTRPVTLDCLRKDLRRDAWSLYRATFRWNLALKRWKYLVGFPLRALVS